jgi:hypothetical protein
MNTFETFATVEDQGRVQVIGVPFAAGTQVEVTISPKLSPGDASDTRDQTLTAARARMQELFRTVKGFRMAPKIPREELYDRRGRTVYSEDLNAGQNYDGVTVINPFAASIP